MNPVARLRVSVSRRALRAVLGSTSLRARLARAREGAMREHRLPEELAVLLALADLAGRHIYKQTPARARRGMVEDIQVVDDAPEGRVSTRPLVFEGPAGPLRARLYEPAEITGTSAGLVFFHGGGWVVGDLDSHDTLCRRLALLAGLRVVAIDYRLAPEHRFPAAAHDAVAAFRRVADAAKSLHLDPARIAIAGDSAGGNLSAVVGLRTRADAIRPALQVLIYPAVDATRSMPSHKTLGVGYFLDERSIEWYLDHYVEESKRRDPDVSPLLADDVSGAPRALIYTADLDPLRDEAKAYAEKLATAGVRADYKNFEGLVHGFALMTGVSPASKRATEEIARAMREALAS